MPKPTAPTLITVLGPTATGKTRLAVAIAARIGGEIISADSRQVYQGMDIGTGKDLEEYQVGDRRIKYHLIDILKPETDFSVFDFQKLFYETFADIRRRGAFPMMVGGTSLYLDSVLRGYQLYKTPENPELRARLADSNMDELEILLKSLNENPHNTSDLKTREHAIRAIEILEFKKLNHDKRSRPPCVIHSLNIGIRLERDEIRNRICKRLRQRLETGMIAEAQALRDAGLPWERFAYFGLEYKYLALFLQDLMSAEEMEEKLVTQIGRFAKRQLTWFRKMERHGILIHWFSPDDREGAMAVIAEAGIA